jgi:Mg-chelatase subunit ChlD
VRVSLPLTLTVSLALHAGLMTAVVLSFMPRASSPIGTAHSADAPSILLMRAKAVMSAATVAPKPIASAQPAPVVSLAKPSELPAPPAIPLVEKPTPLPATPPPALALEANPNAHIRALAPDSILSPSPAPYVNSAEAVVFILDVSGSMYEPFAGSTRIALARQTLAKQISALKNGTPFAITLYALNATTSGPLVAASDATREAAIRFIMREVDCGGGTDLPAGLIAAQQLHPGALVLVTDGDLNSAAYTLEARVRELLGPADKSPAFTVIGIAPRASERAQPLLESLADQQGGTYRTAVSESSAELVSAAPNVKPASATP